MARILCENGALLDPAAGELRPGTSVLVEADRIFEVSDRPIRANEARRIDARGHTRMPALIDAHVHATITTLDLAAMQGDLLVVEGDPLRDLALLEGQDKHLAVILRDGELVVNRISA